MLSEIICYFVFCCGNPTSLQPVQFFTQINEESFITVKVVAIIESILKNLDQNVSVLEM